jgi:hypothetical protein
MLLNLIFNRVQDLSLKFNHSDYFCKGFSNLKSHKRTNFPANYQFLTCLNHLLAKKLIFQ